MSSTMVAMQIGTGIGWLSHRPAVIRCSLAASRPVRPIRTTAAVSLAQSALPCRSSLQRQQPAQSRSVLCTSSVSDLTDFPEPPSQPTGFDKFVETLTTMFPIWVILGAAIGIMRPSAVTWLDSDKFTYALGFLMLSMGLTLTVEDFKQCAAKPAPILVGYFGQYCIKPLLGLIIARVLNLSPALATGLILVSCCPGGQASNVATYIAHGDVALSVLMTTASTVGAIFMTPLLTKLLAGALVPVDAAGLAWSTFQVVLVPTILGVTMNELFPKVVKKITRVLPLIGVVLTTLLCASPVGQVSEVLKTMGPQLAAPVALLHAFAFGLGYFMCKVLGFNEKTARTVSIETGMQSAALGFMLAQAHFADAMVAVPSAVSVVFMALGGSALAVYWRNKPINELGDAVANKNL
eukprot:CAMPEP_0206139832 /NCGR_PEP_ID=MMETSP1473-20131121/7478_1 /ASSEMBLY_ACC=CAM_ASM_001109 /TAXON_ID=1461547 /ORGANISM="Stichococcus sp, Strain RCC1054" /LENGTH=407 /DNA_ID=CAMNT_0053533751 /DNA_START=26 /DNA_END=1249 /DNA_ORIENTATION=+